MTLNIRYKLIIAFSALALGITLISFLAMLFSFRAGFLQYLNDIRHTSLENVKETLLDEVATDAQWHELVSDKRLWLEIIQKSRQNRPLFLPPALKKKDLHRHRYSEHENSDAINRPRLRHLRPPPYVLLNADKEFIYSPAGKTVSVNDLLLSDVAINERLHGYIGIVKLKDISNRADKFFVIKQTEYFIGIAVIACLFAVLVAFLVAGRMSAPIQKLVFAMNRLMLRDYNNHINYKANDEIGSLVQSFNQLSTSLDDHQQSQQRWIADISHELRTPLSTLKAELEAMQDGVREISMKRINSLHDDIIRLQKLVDDLHKLALSDSGALTYQFTSVSIPNLLQDVFEHHEIELESRGLSYELSYLPKLSNISVYADIDRLYQLFENLLQNSMRYTSRGGQILIRVDASATDTITIEWEDSSPGVSSDSLHHLFKRLYRAEKSRNREKGGSGLGLSICKAIVDAHSGSISAHNSSLGGLRITVLLPKSKVGNESIGEAK